MTGTFPEFYGIVIMTIEEVTKIQKNSCWLNLIRMDWRVKDFIDCINEISNNDDFWNVVEAQRLINATSDGK